jgi:hypothetical protein
LSEKLKSSIDTYNKLTSEASLLLEKISEVIISRNEAMSSSNLGLDDPCFKDLLPNERKELFNAISSELTPIDNIFLDSNTDNNT